MSEATNLVPPLRATNARRVLIFRIGSLGDTIVTLPCFHLVARLFPDAKRVLITNRPRMSRSAASWAILGNSGLVHACWQIRVGARDRFGLLKLLFRIWFFRPDVLVYLSERSRIGMLHRDVSFFKLAGLREIHGLLEDEELRSRIDPISGEIEREAERLARTISTLGDADPGNPANWDLRLTERELGKAEALMGSESERTYLVCGPGTNRQSTDWGKERWKELFSLLKPLGKSTTLVLVGATDDAELAEEISTFWTGERINLCGRLDPRETAAVMKRSHLYVGPDSGPMHLAAAVGTRCVAILSARNLPKVWFPFGDQHRIFYSAVECRGCEIETCIDEKRRCLELIRAEKVAEAVLEAFAIRTVATQ